MKKECPICSKNHAIYFCDKFLSLDIVERQNKAKELNICLNCLKKGHYSTKCTSRGCLKCNKKHNTLLHGSGHVQSLAATCEQNIKQKSSETTKPIILAAQTADDQEGYVFLGTILAEIIDNDGKTLPCRILLDSGSQLNFITEKMRKKLNLPNTQVNLDIAGIGDATVKVTDRLHLRLNSRINKYSTQIEAHVIKEISANQPQRFINIDNWKLPNNIMLADPEFYKPQKIDILLGAEIYGEIMRNGQFKLSEKLPLLQNTTFGWIVLGKVANTEYSKPFCGITNVELDEQLHRFWEVDEYPQKSIMSINDKKCEEYFANTTIRNSDGRFVVNLPMLSDPRLLGDSRTIAYKRFLSLEKRLMHDSALKEQYSDFLKEYIQLGHMREVKAEDVTGAHYFLPHHCVLKPSSSTTKLRVVFDASTKTSSNISLNDLLLKGPKIQDDLVAIILRFRTKRYVFTADIVKMYRQIILAEEDRNFQLIMWRDNPTEAIKYYQLCTVTYGTKSAPYLAVKCLQKLAQDEEEQYPLALRAVKDFYVDDIMTGSDNLGEALETQRQLNVLLASGCLKLRKWCANHPKLIENIPKEDLEIKLDFSDLDGEYVKTLGLVWHPVADCFSVTSAMKTHKKMTKRTVLADMSQIFDPLGLVNPGVLTSKIFIQELWKRKLDWNDDLSPEFCSSWSQFRQELEKLTDIKVPRHIFSEKTPIKTDLHAFSDASEKAYGTVLYIRSEDARRKVTVRLLCSKSRVAPIKPTTLPRLELCAAKLMSQLVHNIKNDLNLKIDNVYYWTDSQIVISWIKGDPSTLKTFVANRVARTIKLELH